MEGRRRLRVLFSPVEAHARLRRFLFSLTADTVLALYPREVCVVVVAETKIAQMRRKSILHR